jgi:HD-GYP domain-containing protein (c-di-GMP phosphodiesterase class II)
MLKRIVVVGASESEIKAIQKKIKAKDVHLVPSKSSSKLSGITDSVIYNADESKAIAKSIQQADRALATLELLAQAIDCREAFRPESSKRLVEHATRFAVACKLSKDDQVLLERSALLRDIGKLQIPNNVLLKDGLLTFDEWKLIQNHTSIGADLVADMDGLAQLAPIIRSHHECFDGDGYPRKLEGEEIPILSRMLKIIDVYCAMTSHRSYRNNISSADDALAHLKNERGKNFDSDLIDYFLAQKVGDGKSQNAES